MFVVHFMNLYRMAKKKEKIYNKYGILHLSFLRIDRVICASI